MLGKKEPKISILEIPKRGKKRASLLAFIDEKGKTVGRLDILNKKVVFRGQCDQAARKFFQVCKGFIDEYIKESLTPKVTPEEEKADNSVLGRAMRKVGLKKFDVLTSRMREGRLIIVTKSGQKFKIDV